MAPARHVFWLAVCGIIFRFLFRFVWFGGPVVLETAEISTVLICASGLLGGAGMGENGTARLVTRLEPFGIQPVAKPAVGKPCRVGRRFRCFRRCADGECVNFSHF